MMYYTLFTYTIYSTNSSSVGILVAVSFSMFSFSLSTTRQNKLPNIPHFFCFFFQSVDTLIIQNVIE